MAKFRNIILLILFFFPLAGFSQLKYLDRDNGFENIQLGENIGLLGNKVVLSADANDGVIDGVQFYRVVDTTMLLYKNARINNILVGVYDKKIAYIHLSLDDDNGEKLLRAIKKMYGDGFKPKRLERKYRWKSTHVILRVNFENPDHKIILFAERDLNAAVFKGPKN